MATVDRYGPILRLCIPNAVAYVDLEHNRLTITSDWGHWSYVWGAPPRALDVFLFERTHFDYLADKLFMGEPRERRFVYDERKTKSELRRQLARAYRDGANASDEFRNEMYQNAVAEIEDAESFEELCEACGSLSLWLDVTGEDEREMDSHYYTQLRDHILPKLAAAWMTWNSRA